jgi:hypothetical protein
MLMTSAGVAAKRVFQASTPTAAATMPQFIRQQQQSIEEGSVQFIAEPALE